MVVGRRAATAVPMAGRFDNLPQASWRRGFERNWGQGVSAPYQHNHSVAPEAEPPGFGIEALYVRDLSFEAPGAPSMLIGDWTPHVATEVDTRSTRLGPIRYEVALRLTVRAYCQDELAYLCEVEQCGAFVIGGFDARTLTVLLEVNCPSQLFPYARQAISDSTGRGGFIPLTLAPIDFGVLYKQRRR